MPDEQLGGEQRGIVAALLPDAGDRRVGSGVGELVEPALERGGSRLGVEPGGADTLIAEKALQVGDVHAQREQTRGHGVPEQVRIDALGDPGGSGHPADDLADALPGQGVRHGAGHLLAVGEQRSGAAGADVEPEQLGQVTPDRHLAALHAVDAAVSFWRAAVVRPVRAARRALKPPPGHPFDPGAASALRERLLAAEIEAERVQ